MRLPLPQILNFLSHSLLQNSYALTQVMQAIPTALLYEANAIAAMDRDQANELRSRAEQLLLQHAKAAPEVVAYNLACVYGQRGDVSSCLHWLQTAQAHNKLVSYEHLLTNADLDAVRNHPDFQAWLQSVCSH